SPRVSADQLYKIVSEIDKRRKILIVLIDDLQKTNKFVAGELRNLEALVRQTEELIAAAKRTGKIKIVLCEPTNLEEWLKSDSKEQACRFFREVFLPYALVSDQNLLPRFKTDSDEAYQLLAAVVEGKPRIPDLDEDLCRLICHDFGGNPWLLAHAHKV